MRGFFTWVTRSWLRGAGFLLAAIVTAGIAAPFIDAAAYAGSIQRALETSLGRKVTFSQAHFTLLFGPGFSLSDVTIGEDPRFGAEPFAYVPTVQARVRLDRLLTGRISFASLRLVEPSINLVRGKDGDWNMMELASRIDQSSTVPLHLLPAVQISDGRLDFKLGVRKTNIYITDANVSVYGEDAGKLYIQFSGSPARTDRAGNGFGNFSGHVNWYPHPATADANQLEGSITLDRSNLSELSTLFQGEDSGVHATVSGSARIAGPASALHVSGNLHLEDIHRWDLLPSSGEDLRVAYQGVVDLPARSIDLKTVPADSGDATPVALAVKGTDFLSHPTWSVSADLNGAPVTGLLPLARRMGLNLPDNLNLDGVISGSLLYSTGVGWTGGVGISNFIASVPNVPPFRASSVEARIDPNHIRLETARITSNETGWLDLAGDYDRAGEGLRVSLTMDAFPAKNLRDLFANWVKWPTELDSLESGDLTGGLDYVWSPDLAPAWSGKFEIASAALSFPGVPGTITNAKGEVTFDDEQIGVDRFSGTFDKHSLQASYHYDSASRKPARIHVIYAAADLGELQDLLVTSRRENWLTRLGVTRYRAPEWLLARNVQGDVDLPALSLGGITVGDLQSRIRWEGTTLQLTSLQLRMPEGEIAGSGSITLSGAAPKYKLTGSMSGLPWRGGFLSADGSLQSSGAGSDLLQRLEARGSFSGQEMAFSPEDQFGSVSGKFQLSFADGWPNLRLTSIQATDGDEEWTGVAASSSDGKLVFDLQHDGRQRHVVSTLAADDHVLTRAALR